MMKLLGWAALIFLTLSGYSAGAVVGRRIRQKRKKDDPVPSLADTLMVTVLWLGGIVSRLTKLDQWQAVGLWFAVALGAGCALGWLQAKRHEDKKTLPL